MIPWVLDFYRNLLNKNNYDRISGWMGIGVFVKNQKTHTKLSIFNTIDPFSKRLCYFIKYSYLIVKLKTVLK